ncbi:hypothetical protein U472_13240 [Orenia metallireducens]|uniref:Uncharacterized protein n=1 Tax=Orenia metallireducens TaxID=1413210 RepID=A0A1C0A5D2_9FIRM|nr:hypothetical protein [Orenia metallireducens]OCL25316.1 hypothetical protein U472_13240 [Orenia metallireducens]
MGNNTTELGITHRELLTFSNLTNLEWQFVNLESSTIDTNGVSRKRSNKLKDILSDPESFAERDDSGNFESYVYMKNVKREGDITQEDIEEAKIKMRKNAGIAMEYLEKWEDEKNSEGKFIEDWEVVYGGDNYKIVSEFLDEISDGNIDYPSREDAKDEQKALQKLETTMKYIDLAILGASIAIPHSIAMGLKGIKGYKPLIQSGLKGVATEVGQTFSRTGLNKALTEMSEEIASGIARNGVKYIIPASLNQCSQITFNTIGMAKEKVGTELTQEHLDKLERTYEEISQLADSDKLAANEIKITLSHKLSMYDTGLRVLVLKKGKEIVITYKLPEDRRKEGALPEEFELLDMVYQRIARDFSEEEGYNIRFTGYEGGGDLSLISSLQYEKASSIFSIDTKSLRGIVDFTEKDIENDYKDLFQILIDTGKDVLKTSVESIIICSIFMGGTALPWVLFDVLVRSVLNVLKEWSESLKIERVLDILQSEALGYISKEEHKGIKGYITDTYRNQESIWNGGPISIKKSDLLYYLMREGRLPKLEVGYQGDENQYYFEIQNLTGRYVRYEFLILEKNKEKHYYEITRVETSKLISDVMGSVKEIKELITNDKSRYDIEHVKEFTDKDGIAFENLLDVTSDIQRNYLNLQEKIEIIYYDRTSKSIKIANNHLDIKQEGKLDDIILNEYVFFPYLNKDGIINTDDNTNTGDLKIREEYIFSVFRSAMHNYKIYKTKECILRVNSIIRASERKKVYDNEFLYPIKFDSKHENRNRYIHNFNENNFNEKPLNSQFLEIIKYELHRDGMTFMFNDYEGEDVPPFNHYNVVLKILEEKPELLDKFYEVKNIKEVNPRSQGLFDKDSDIDGEIFIKANNKSSLEYKYNRDDYIIGGGELKIIAQDLPDEYRDEKKEDKVAFKELSQTEFMAIKDLIEPIKNNQGDISNFEDIDFEIAEADLYNDNIDKLLKDKNNKNPSYEKNSTLLKKRYMA